MFLLAGNDLSRLTARARYCPSEIARGLVPVAAGGPGEDEDDMVSSTARRCTLATVARFGKAAVCVEWIEPGEVRPRYHVATDDGDGVAMPPWSSYDDQRRIASPGVRAIGIKPKGEPATDCTRDIKGMTVTGRYVRKEI